MRKSGLRPELPDIETLVAPTTVPNNEVAQPEALFKECRIALVVAFPVGGIA